MKVIFLDIDGVLVTHNSIRKHNHHEAFDDEAVKNLNHIIMVTGANLVITSTWRIYHDIKELSDRLDFAGVNTSTLIDYTPCLDKTPAEGFILYSCQERGIEIQAWLDRKDWIVPMGNRRIFGIELESFVIIDDEADMAHLLPRLVNTDFDTGITTQCAVEAISILNVPYMRR